MATVSITQGILQGGISKTESGFEYFEFLGIPYAKPPIGDLRFKSPQPPESWENARDATTTDSTNIATQVDFLCSGMIIGSEDCLYLNVFSPKLPETGTELRPVMVYIHAGGFIFGNGTLKTENGPDYLVENDVVVVTINYRVGVLGFLSLDIPEAAGNMGLKDQVKALEWIQHNIDKFGGDKDNVTIFGISAGSAAVEYLILSPLAKGLFHKAILQSGSTLNDWALNYKPKRMVLALLENLDYKGSTDDNQAIYQFLLKLPAPTLSGLAFQVSENFTSTRVFFGFVPVVEKDFGDGEAFLTNSPYKILKEGNFNKVAVVRGFCNNEGSLASMMKPNAVKELMDKKAFVSFWPYELDSNDIANYNSKLEAAYLENASSEKEDKEFAVDFFADLNFVAGVWLSAKLQARRGVPVYLYKFSYDGKLNAFKVIYGLMKKGALHGDDQGYVFRHFALTTPNEDDVLVRKRLTLMWTNFAKTGNPTPANCTKIPVEWPAFTEESLSYLSIDKDLALESNYEPKRMDIFEEIYNKYGK